MKRLLFLLMLFLCPELLSACGHGGGGGAAANPAEGSTWDQMKWDQGKWG
jgi:hypothetical protein